MLRFALAWAGSLVAVAVGIWSHDVSSASCPTSSGVAQRSALAAQADSICAAIAPLSQSSVNVAQDLKSLDQFFKTTDQATQRLRRLKPPAAADWRRFLAGALANDRDYADVNDDVAVPRAARARRERTETKGDAAARTLGIDCQWL